MWLSPAHELEDFPTDLAKITSYCSLVLTGLGFIGNGLLIKLSTNHEVRKFSCCVFLFTLAISDSIVLVYEVTDDIAINVNNLTKSDILFGKNEWRCRFGIFFYQTARTLSAWLVVAMAAELFLASTIPERRSHVYNTKRTLYVTMAVLLVSAAAGFPFLVLTKSGAADVTGSASDVTASCSSEYEVFYLVYSVFVLKIVTHWGVPLIFVVVCCARAAYYLARYKDNRMRSNSLAAAMQYNDRRGAVKNKPCQAPRVVAALSALYVLSLLPTTVTEALIYGRIFSDSVEVTWPWYYAVYVSNVVVLVNYALKFYVVLLVGSEYRSAFAGRRTISLAEQTYAMSNGFSSAAAGYSNGSAGGIEENRF